MKLNLKNTIKVGFAFAIIMVFWTTYDFVVPLLLENAFGLSHTMRGLIMGLDNLLSLFMLPLFGRLSDKTKSKWGRRTPYIFIGTIISCILMIFVPISANKALKDGMQLREKITSTEAENYSYKSLDGKYNFENKTQIYTFLYNEGNTNSDYSDHTYMKKSGVETLDHYLRIAENPYKNFKDANDLVGEKSVNKKGVEVLSENYNKFVKAGINNYASKEVGIAAKTNHKASLVLYMIILFLVLVAMAVYRSPAVALMPDVTPKPLRSQANAIINLAGGVGGAVAFVIYTVTLMVNPTGFIAIFSAVACAMILLLTGFMLLVKEKKLVKECEEICEQYGISNEEEEELVRADGTPISQVGEEATTLKRAKMISFFLILASIFMWFMGYNAVTSTLSIFLTKTLLVSPGWASIVSGISMGISAIAFIPVGILAVKIGRRKSIMLGFGLAVLSFLLIFLFAGAPASASVYLFTVFYLIAGFGLIIANVNTFPMVVELSSAKDVGKYTGLYYTATMSAQAITPFIAGIFMDKYGSKTLFIYSLVCVALAIVLMFFVKHGDSKPLPKSKKDDDLEPQAETVDEGLQNNIYADIKVDDDTQIEQSTDESVESKEE